LGLLQKGGISVGQAFKRLKYSADFECTTDEEDCRVWAWAVCRIGDVEDLEYGNTIETFFDFCKRDKNVELYFHNLS